MKKIIHNPTKKHQNVQIMTIPRIFAIGNVM